MSIILKNKVLIGIINDEISDDLETAFRFCSEHGLDYINLRSSKKVNVINWQQRDFERAMELSEKYVISIYGIMSPLFKNTYNGVKAIFKQVDYVLPFKLDDFSMAKYNAWLNSLVICKPQYIRIFSPLKAEINLIDRWLPLFEDTLDSAYSHNILMGIENEPVCQLDSYLQVLGFLDSNKHKALGNVWDPGNDLSASGETCLHIRDQVLNNILEIHLKDWDCHKKSWVILGDGDLNLLEVISQPSSRLCLEPHVGFSESDKIKSALLSLNALKNILTT